MSPNQPNPSSMTGEQRLLEACIRTEGLGKDIADIKTSVRDMALAITRLAIFEERQGNDRAAIERLSQTQERHDTRIGSLELSRPVQNLFSDWIQKAVWLVLAAVISAVLVLVIATRQEQPARTLIKPTIEVTT